MEKQSNILTELITVIESLVLENQGAKYLLEEYIPEGVNWRLLLGEYTRSTGKRSRVHEQFLEAIEDAHSASATGNADQALRSLREVVLTIHSQETPRNAPLPRNTSL